MYETSLSRSRVIVGRGRIPFHGPTKIQGQVKPAIISSNDSPEHNATSKAEYTNTQQDLRVQWIYLVHLTRHARLFSSGVSFAEKQQRVDPYFQILAFKILVGLTSLGKHLSIQVW